MVSLDVFLQVVFSAERFVTQWARKRSEPRVNPLVPGELLVARERLAAALVFAGERPLSCAIDIHVC